LRKLHFFDCISAQIFGANVTNVCRQNRSRKYLPTPFKNGFAYYGALRLSPGDRAEGVDGNSDAYNTRIRGKETKVPVAFQRRLARAQCHVPYLEGPVIGS